MSERRSKRATAQVFKQGFLITDAIISYYCVFVVCVCELIQVWQCEIILREAIGEEDEIGSANQDDAA